MLPIAAAKFDELGPLIARLAASPQLSAWAQAVAQRAASDDQVDVAYALAAPVERELALCNGTAAIVLAGAMASVGLSVRLEGLSYADRDQVDVIHVLAIDAKGNWIPVTPWCGSTTQTLLRCHGLNYVQRSAA